KTIRKSHLQEKILICRKILYLIGIFDIKCFQPGVLSPIGHRLSCSFMVWRKIIKSIMFMKKLLIPVLCLSGFLAITCDKMDSTYRDFLQDGPIIYSQRVD